MQRSDKELKTQHDDKTRKLEYVILMNWRFVAAAAVAAYANIIRTVEYCLWSYDAARLERAPKSKYESDGQKLKLDHRTRRRP